MSLGLSGTLLCPSTQVRTQGGLTLKLEVSQQVPTGKRSQSIYERTSRASLITSSPVGNGTEETIGGTVDRGPTTTDVAHRDG